MAFRVKVGDEISFVEHRLKDIAFLAKHAKPVEGCAPEVLTDLIAELADDALRYFRIGRSL